MALSKGAFPRFTPSKRRSKEAIKEAWDKEAEKSRELEYNATMDSGKESKVGYFGTLIGYFKMTHAHKKLERQINKANKLVDKIRQAEVFDLDTYVATGERTTYSPYQYLSLGESVPVRTEPTLEPERREAHPESREPEMSMEEKEQALYAYSQELTKLFEAKRIELGLSTGEERRQRLKEAESTPESAPVSDNDEYNRKLEEAFGRATVAYEVTDNASDFSPELSGVSTYKLTNDGQIILRMVGFNQPNARYALLTKEDFATDVEHIEALAANRDPSWSDDFGVRITTPLSDRAKKLIGRDVTTEVEPVEKKPLSDEKPKNTEEPEASSETKSSEGEPVPKKEPIGRKVFVYDYEHNDGDQIWNDTTSIYLNSKTKKLTLQYRNGWNGEESSREISTGEFFKRMKDVTDSMETHRGRGGYSILLELSKKDRQTISAMHRQAGRERAIDSQFDSITSNKDNPIADSQPECD